MSSEQNYIHRSKVTLRYFLVYSIQNHLFSPQKYPEVISHPIFLTFLHLKLELIKVYFKIFYLQWITYRNKKKTLNDPIDIPTEIGFNWPSGFREV